MKDFKLKDVLISITIVLVTLLYFADEYLIPKGLETVNIFGMKIESFGFLNINHFVYYMKVKFLVLFFSITWYLTCKHWWKSSILVIITIELFKLVTALNSNQMNIDYIDYLVSLPITLPIILLLIFISKKLNDFNLTKELRSDIDQEIDDLFFEFNYIEKNKIEFLNQELINLKKTKQLKNSEKYLNDLISLRDDFFKSIG
jgi:hypothetical protein